MIPIKTQFRIPPTDILYSSLALTNGLSTIAITTYSPASMTTDSSVDSINLTLNVTSGLTAGQASFIIANNTSNAYIRAIAEFV